MALTSGERIGLVAGVVAVALAAAALVALDPLAASIAINLLGAASLCGA